MIYYNDKSGRVERETDQKAAHRKPKGVQPQPNPVQLVFKWNEELSDSRQNRKVSKQKHSKASKMQSNQTVASPMQLSLPFEWDFEWSVPTDEELEEIYEEMMKTSEELRNRVEDCSVFNDYNLGK